MRVKNQFNHSCGYHAIANAIATQNLYIHGESITSENIAAEASMYLEGLLIAKGFAADWQVALAVVTAAEKFLFSSGQRP